MSITPTPTPSLAIETIVYRVRNPESQARFYCDVLGMSPQSQNGAIGYSGPDASLRFLPVDADYLSEPNDLYWKIALAVPDIELACQQLTERGVSVSEPHQFQDIGYLAHFKDPTGLTIELIEHWFKGNRPAQVQNTCALGGGAHLNLLTLRAVDIKPVQRITAAWGMKPLSIQPVPNHGFTLHFFACTDDVPPNPDLHAVANREWLYQRPYTVLEVQHLHSAEEIRNPGQGDAGYEVAVVSGLGEVEIGGGLRMVGD